MSPSFGIRIALGIAWVVALQAHSEDEHEGGGVRMGPAGTIQLDAAASEALGIRLVRVKSGTLDSQLELEAQWVDPTTVIARVPVSLLPRVRRSQPEAAELLAIDESVASAIGYAQVRFRVQRDPSFVPGGFRRLVLRERVDADTIVPRNAVVDAATGPFVFEATGDGFEHRRVELGVQGVEAIAIRHGLSTTAEVVAEGAQDLWLVELRMTKGGGHAH